jgi:hypothetical protein
VSEEDACISGIIKEIDVEPAYNYIDEQLYINVFLETYKCDVAIAPLRMLGNEETLLKQRISGNTDNYVVSWKDNIQNLINDDAITLPMKTRRIGFLKKDALHELLGELSQGRWKCFLSMLDLEDTLDNCYCGGFGADY